jgi:hypothetical protein
MSFDLEWCALTTPILDSIPSKVNMRMQESTALCNGGFKMALTHKYTVVCELARPEMIGGKFFIVGLFPNGIATPVVPFPMPMLTFLTLLEADGPCNCAFTGRLSQLVTGETVGVPVNGRIQIPGPGSVALVNTIQNPPFRAFGIHTWSIEAEGNEPFVTEFPITQVNPQQPQQFPFQMRR